VSADSTSLTTSGLTMLHAAVDPGTIGPVRFRWECSRGYITGDSGDVQFYAGGRYLGPATITVVGIDATGHANSVTMTIDIQPAGPAAIQALTLGTGPNGMASGRVFKVDLTQYKLVVGVQVPNDLVYIQPFTDMKSVWIGPDGFWWTPVANGNNGSLVCWLVPKDYVPPDSLPIGFVPPGTVATATLAASNDSDNDLLPDSWEMSNFGNLAGPACSFAHNLTARRRCTAGDWVVSHDPSSLEALGKR
jgi:hypothetical protein